MEGRAERGGELGLKEEEWLEGGREKGRGGGWREERMEVEGRGRRG